MVSPPVRRTCSIWPRTLRCSPGWMLPRNRYGSARYDAGSFGSKPAKTFRSVRSVVRSFISAEYTPAQKKVFPSATRSSPSRSMWRERSRSVSSCAKSLPTTATIFTGLKYEAASEMYVAAPPSMRSTFPCGVSTPSYATEPTTMSDMLREDSSNPRSGLVRKYRTSEIFPRLFAGGIPHGGGERHCRERPHRHVGDVQRMAKRHCQQAQHRADNPSGQARRLLPVPAHGHGGAARQISAADANEANQAAQKFGRYVHLLSPCRSRPRDASGAPLIDGSAGTASVLTVLSGNSAGRRPSAQTTNTDRPTLEAGFCKQSSG